jgi:hypothetical protein
VLPSLFILKYLRSIIRCGSPVQFRVCNTTNSLQSLKIVFTEFEDACQVVGAPLQTTPKWSLGDFKGKYMVSVTKDEPCELQVFIL